LHGHGGDSVVVAADNRADRPWGCVMMYRAFSHMYGLSETLETMAANADGPDRQLFRDLADAAAELEKAVGAMPKTVETARCTGHCCRCFFLPFSHETMPHHRKALDAKAKSLGTFATP